VNEVPRLKRVCAWCGAGMGFVLSSPSSDTSATPDAPEKMTHGMCAMCYEDQLNQLNTLIGEAAELRGVSRIQASRTRTRED